MNFLGVGPLELAFIFIIVLLIFGPNDIVKAGKTLGNLIRQVVTSPTWKTIQKTSRDIRTLPNTLARQAGLDEIQKELSESTDLDRVKKTYNLGAVDPDKDTWVTPTSGKKNPEPSIAPPPPPEEPPDPNQS